MSLRHCLRNLLWCLLFVSLACTLPTLKGDDSADKEIVLKDCLVIKAVGQSGRSPVHIDAIEADLVAGRWKPPVAGDAVQVPHGPNRAWEAAPAHHPALHPKAPRAGCL